jgi:hypothetical protein
MHESHVSIFAPIVDKKTQVRNQFPYVNLGSKFGWHGYSQIKISGADSGGKILAIKVNLIKQQTPATGNNHVAQYASIMQASKNRFA